MKAGWFIRCLDMTFLKLLRKTGITTITYLNVKFFAEE